MKMFLRKVNRGVVLAILLVVGLTVYIAADSMRFGDEADKIKDTIENMLSSCEDINLYPEQYRTPNTAIPQEVYDDKIDELNSFADTYFAEPKNIPSGNYNLLSDKQRIKENYTWIFNAEGDHSGGRVTDIQYALSNISGIIKHGSDMATIYFTVQKDINASISAAIFDITEVSTVEGISRGWGGYVITSTTASGMVVEVRGDESGDADDTTVTQVNVSVNYEAIMRKVDGIWKIVQINRSY